MTGIWFEQLEHSPVRPPGFSGQGPCHQIRNVIVPNRNGVGIAEGAQSDLGNLTGKLRGSLEPRGALARRPNELRSPALDAHRVERIVGLASQEIGGRRYEQPARPGGTFAETQNQSAPYAPSFYPGDLLLEDRGHQGLDHRPRPPKSNPGIPSPQISNDRMTSLESRVVIGSSHEIRRRLERPQPAWPPRPHFQPACRDA